MGLANVARTLDVAAPTLAVDEGAPWTNVRGASQWTLASIFWLSFHGLSTLLHGMAVFFSVGATLLPIPFIAGMCALVEPQVKPIERVEMSIVEVKPPPPEPEPVKRASADEGDMVVAKLETKPKKAKAKNPEVALLKMLDTHHESAILGVLSTKDENVASLFGTMGDSVEGGVVGGLVGLEVGESYGYGGLGLSGVGRGGGGTGEGTIGLGTIGRGTGGSVGVGGGSGSGYGAGGFGAGAVVKRKVTVALDGATAAQIKRIASGLESCGVDEELVGTVVVVDGRITRVTTSPRDACVERRLRTLVTFDAKVNGELPLVVTPKS